MNIRPKHILLMVGIVCVMAAAGVLFMFYPKHLCTWEYTYDDNGNLVTEELLFPKGKGPSQGLYYEYDEAGNLRTVTSVDYSYDDNNYVRDFENGDPTADWDYACTYYEDGSLESFAMGVSTADYFEEKRFTYTYDKKGRIATIEYMESSLGEETRLTAKFSYHWFSKSYTARVYNESGLPVAKYVYKFNGDGTLSKVKICYTKLGTDWGRGYLSREYEYPGGELWGIE